MSREEKRKILYIDDEESNLRVFKNLYRRDFDIDTAISAEKGLELFSAKKFDLVISDQRMPETSGLEMLAVIKEKNPLIPTILLTGYTDHDVLKRAFNEVGVHRYINKPFDPDSLFVVIELAIESYYLTLKNNKIQSDLKKSESKFRGIFNSMADVFVRVDHQGKIIVVSPSIEELSGYKQEELLGEHVEKLYAIPEDRSKLIKELKVNGLSRGVETVLLTKSNEKKYISSTSKWYFDEDHSAPGVESVVRDISERKKMEQQLREQGDFLNEVQKMANLGSWQWNYSEDQMIWSDILLEIYGLSKQRGNELTFENYLSYFHHKDKKRIRSTFKNAFESKEDFVFEGTIVREDGTQREIKAWGKIIQNNKGEIKKITVACMDVTETKKKEKALAESEEKFKLLSEQSPIKILKVNRKFRVEYANKLACNDFKNKGEEKRQIQHFFDSKLHPVIVRSIQKVFETNEVQSVDYELVDDKESSWLSIDFTPLMEELETRSVLILVHDITAKKKVESMLRNMNQQLEEKVIKRTQALEKAKDDLEVAYQQEKQLSRLKSQFVSTASHQFRTPLTVIQSNIGLLEMQIAEADSEFKKKFDKVYKRIHSEVLRMTDLMDNVLILGKRESGAIKPSFQMVDVLALVESVVEQYNQIQSDGRAIKVSFSGSPSMFHLDPELLENAISNLVSNAFKYSQECPSPQVHLLYKSSKLHITIQDFGLGIPKEDLENIFEPFYRGTNVKDINGTGLGTSIVKTYLDLMGAKISIKSKKNEGTKFIIKVKK